MPRGRIYSAEEAEERRKASQRKANYKWQKKAQKQIILKLHKEYDKDIIEFLDVLPNRTELLKKLIRKEMKRQAKKK